MPSSTLQDAVLLCTEHAAIPWCLGWLFGPTSLSELIDHSIAARGSSVRSLLLLHFAATSNSQEENVGFAICEQSVSESFSAMSRSSNYNGMSKFL
jgi:hypothetical protein